jgi:hypothetical protein
MQKIVRMGSVFYGEYLLPESQIFSKDHTATLKLYVFSDSDSSN